MLTNAQKRAVEAMKRDDAYLWGRTWRVFPEGWPRAPLEDVVDIRTSTMSVLMRLGYVEILAQGYCARLVKEV